MDIILILLSFVFFFELIDARGSMVDPPQRSSLWRFRPWKKDKTIPHNLEDYGLNCGGFWRLHGINKGQCGVCGDPYDTEPRQNEAGGKYANGIIVRRYRQNRKFINVTIDITSNIGGYFEFRLCPNDNVSAVVTQDCFDKHLLTIHEHGRKFYPKGDEKFKLALDMPEDITCKQCVLQWKWRGSYNWGRCDDGYQDVGCGNQEEYYNCADIAIIPSKRGRKTTPQPSTPEPETSTEATPTDQWKQIVNKDIIKDTMQTVPDNKDVKTMIKDVTDIKSIDSIYSPSTNVIDPFGIGDLVQTGISGIPVYVVPTETSPYLPDITVVPGFDRTNQVLPKVSTTLPPIIAEPIPVPLPPEPSKPSTGNVENTIVDLTSSKITDGIKQDLVQPPGNEVLSNAKWLEGSTSHVSGVGASSGEGKVFAPASASAASTNQPQLPNLAVHNTSFVDLLHDMTTPVDPLILQKKSNLLNQMFYGAVATGVDPELENLLPFSLLPFNLFGGNQQPLFGGDTTDQLIRTMYTLNQERKLNLTNEQSAMLDARMSTLNAEIVPTAGTFIDEQTLQPPDLGMLTQIGSDNTLTKVSNAVEIPTKESPSNSIQKVDTATPPQAKPNGQIIDPLSTVTKTTTGMADPTVSPWNQMLLNMNNMLVSLSDHIDTIVQGQKSTGQGQNKINQANQGHDPVPQGQSTVSPVESPVSAITGRPNNMARLVNRLTPGQTDGVVVSSLQKSEAPLQQEADTVSLVHSIGSGKVNQISDITSNSINQNLQLLSQQNQVISSQSVNPEQNGPLVISDPKSKFSFQNLDARNVEVLGDSQSNVKIQANTNPVAQANFVSNNGNNFVISDVSNQAVSDIAQSSLNANQLDMSRPNDVIHNPSPTETTNTQKANSILFEKMLGRLNSGVMVSNSKQPRSVEKVSVKAVSKDSMKKALETLYRGEGETTKENQNAVKSKTPNVWDMAKKITTRKNQVLPTEVASYADVLYNPLLNNGLLVHPGTPMGTASAPLFSSFDSATNNLFNVLSWGTQTTTPSPLGFGLFHGNVIA